MRTERNEYEQVGKKVGDVPCGVRERSIDGEILENVSGRFESRSLEAMGTDGDTSEGLS